jgi:cytoskeleton protein RodZ
VLYEEVSAAELGRELREARLRLGLSVGGVSTALRIRRIYIEALEAGLPSELPSHVHVVGYARIYAAKLGLDPQVVVSKLQRGDRRAPSGHLTVVPPSRVSRKSPTILAVAVGLLVTYLAVALPERRDTSAAEVPQVPTRLAHLSDPAGVAVQPRPAPTPTEVPTIAAPPREVRPAPPSDMEARPVPSAPQNLHPILANRVSLQVASGSIDGVWVRVRVAQSREVVMDRVLRPGEMWRVPPRDGLIVDMGRAHEVRLLVDGVPVVMPADLRGVRRDIVLASLLPDGPQTALPSARPPASAAARSGR